MGNTLTMLLASSVVLTVLGYLLLQPLLYLFGASDETYPYAAAYLRIYLIGTPLAMVGTGMNGFINAQGFGRVGMVTTLMGAAANIVLDPIFIFLLDMGVSGAALATVLSQLLSAAWVMRFLLGKRTLLRLTLPNLRPPAGPWWGRSPRLGVAGFVMSRLQRRGADRLQHHPAGLRRRCVCGGDDGAQLGAGCGLPPLPGAEQRRPSRCWGSTTAPVSSAG